MKICIISSAAIAVPPESYSGLEALMGWLTTEFVKHGHDVTLITTKGSSWAGTHPIMSGDKQIATMNVVETIEPSWNALDEEPHYHSYKNLLEKEFISEDSVVLDSTWFCHSYLSKMKFPQMNLVHIHHGLLGFHSAPSVLHQRFLGLSTYHANYMSTVLKIPCRHVHNGIPLVQFPEDYDPSSNKGNYLLSLNRFTSEKGIHDSIDIAVATNTPIILVGDDTKVVDQRYVNQIIERCRHSNGLATYYGLVDNNTKNRLIQGCKALIACPTVNWQEAFGLYVIEGLSCYKPFLGTRGGLFKHGYNDFIQNGYNGFLADNPEQLKQYVEKIDDIDMRNCRQTVVDNFTKEKMAERYLSLFTKIVEKDNSSFW